MRFDPKSGRVAFLRAIAVGPLNDAQLGAPLAGKTPQSEHPHPEKVALCRASANLLLGLPDSHIEKQNSVRPSISPSTLPEVLRVLRARRAAIEWLVDANLLRLCLA